MYIGKIGGAGAQAYGKAKEESMDSGPRELSAIDRLVGGATKQNVNNGNGLFDRLSQNASNDWTDNLNLIVAAGEAIKSGSESINNNLLGGGNSITNFGSTVGNVIKGTGDIVGDIVKAVPAAAASTVTSVGDAISGAIFGGLEAIGLKDPSYKPGGEIVNPWMESQGWTRAKHMPQWGADLGANIAISLPLGGPQTKIVTMGTEAIGSWAAKLVPKLAASTAKAAVGRYSTKLALNVMSNMSLAALMSPNGQRADSATTAATLGTALNVAGDVVAGVGDVVMPWVKRNLHLITPKLVQAAKTGSFLEDEAALFTHNPSYVFREESDKVFSDSYKKAKDLLYPKTPLSKSTEELTIAKNIMASSVGSTKRLAHINSASDIPAYDYSGRIANTHFMAIDNIKTGELGSRLDDAATLKSPPSILKDIFPDNIDMDTGEVILNKGVTDLMNKARRAAVVTRKDIDEGWKYIDSEFTKKTKYSMERAGPTNYVEKVSRDMALETEDEKMLQELSDNLQRFFAPPDKTIPLEARRGVGYVNEAHTLDDLYQFSKDAKAKLRALEDSTPSNAKSELSRDKMVGLYSTLVDWADGDNGLLGRVLKRADKATGVDKMIEAGIESGRYNLSNVPFSFYGNYAAHSGQYKIISDWQRAMSVFGITPSGSNNIAGFANLFSSLYNPKYYVGSLDLLHQFTALTGGRFKAVPYGTITPWVSTITSDNSNAVREAVERATSAPFVKIGPTGVGTGVFANASYKLIRAALGPDSSLKTLASMVGGTQSEQFLGIVHSLASRIGLLRTALPLSGSITKEKKLSSENKFKTVSPVDSQYIGTIPE